MIQVYLVKRNLRKRKRNGQHEYRWVMRWEAADGFKCETTGTADRTAAESLQKLKWAELNGLGPEREPEPEPIDERPAPTWDECSDAFARAMRADNLRSSSIASAKQAFNVLRRMFPLAASPAEITTDDANEYKRQRAEQAASPWSIRSDLSVLRSIFGKWLGRECGLLSVNPFATVKPPRCDDPEVRIVAAAETEALLTWLESRWNNWRLPVTYLRIAALLGWRATEIGSMRADDLLPDGHVRVLAESSKTRRQKIGWLPDELYGELQACCAGGWAFGRFSDELRRLLILLKKRPHHAARVRDFTPARMVGWIQDELERFNLERAQQAAEAGQPAPEPFTLHDFRRTAITGMQMAGVSEKEASVMVGVTPEVMRRHYEKLDQRTIARRSIERTLSNPDATTFARPLRA